MGLGVCARGRKRRDAAPQPQRIAMRNPSLGDRIGMAVMEPGSLVMERKMLIGIKQRAERLAARAMPARATA